MAQHLKRWESPRHCGRNLKGRGGSARQRQLRKRQQRLRQQLHQNHPKTTGRATPLPVVFLSIAPVTLEESGNGQLKMQP
ncbi:MAG: hypothetical protein KGQ93_04355 [Cyanobacteria bacterium REEB459]|nr:hypothetical protein [Cyanobacteria bacterium REEB459]